MLEHAVNRHAGLAHGHRDALDALVMGQHVVCHSLAYPLEQVVAVFLDLRPAQLKDLGVADCLRQIVGRARRAQVELELDIELDDLGICALLI